MTDFQWEYFENFRKEFKNQIQKWSSFDQQLKILQKKAAQETGTPDYPFETAVVYNKALDEIQKDDQIKIIVTGDNPGKDEQLLKNNKYLVGQAGKLGEGFFRNNPELKTDFRKNVIILNKTPVHSAKTNHLKSIMKNGGKEICNLIEETELWIAEQTLKLAQVMDAKIWLVGYSELKPKGIFSVYRNRLLELCEKSNGTDGEQNFNRIYVYQHFSMNRFSIDLKEFQKNHPDLNLSQALENLGHLHRDEIFGECENKQTQGILFQNP